MDREKEMARELALIAVFYTQTSYKGYRTAWLRKTATVNSSSNLQVYSMYYMS